MSYLLSGGESIVSNLDIIVSILAVSNQKGGSFYIISQAGGAPAGLVLG
jgi:hypothetical protein